MLVPTMPQRYVSISVYLCIHMQSFDLQKKMQNIKQVDIEVKPLLLKKIAVLKSYCLYDSIYVGDNTSGKVV